MLNRIIFLTLLTTVAGAQNKNEEDKKRPSWSQGIPERKATPDMNRPEFKPTDSAIEIESTEPGEAINDFKLDVMTPEITPPSALPELPEPVIRAEPVEVAVAAEVSMLTSPVDEVYDWHIEQRQPVVVPASLLSSERSVLLKISINANGEVIHIETAQTDISDSLTDHVKKSINRWKFAAPKEQGIAAAILTKVFEVNLTTKT